MEKLVRDLGCENDDLEKKLEAATDHGNVIAEVREQNASLTQRLRGIQNLASKRMELLEEIEEQICQYRNNSEVHFTDTNSGDEP